MRHASRARGKRRSKKETVLMQDMRTVKQSINVCHPRQDLRDESHLLSLERSNSISRVGSIVNPKYRFFRKIPHICAAHSANQLKSQFAATCAPKIIQFDFSHDMRVRKIPLAERVSSRARAARHRAECDLESKKPERAFLKSFRSLRCSS